MQRAAMPGAAATRRAQLPTTALALLCGGMLPALVLSLRLGLPQIEGVLAGAQIALFLLSTWLLSTSTTQTATQARITDVVGIVFTAVRYTRFARVAYPFFTPEAPKEFGPIFEDTPFAYAVYAFYVAECALVQVVLHRLLPAWMCAPMAALQAFIFSQCNFRFLLLRSEQITARRMAHIIAAHQVGMFLPYHFMSHPWVRKCLGLMAGQPAAISHAKAAGLTAASVESSLPGSSKQHSKLAGPSVAADSSISGVLGSKLAASAAAAPASVLSQMGLTAQPLVQGLTAPGHTVGAASAEANVAAAIRALAHAPYKSRLRVAHKVCIKLDTPLPCEQLPGSLADQLQQAVRRDIGCATSLNVTEVAVRPGCVAITMTVEELLAAAGAANGAPAGEGSATAASDHSSPEVWARALLPQLQAMLSEVQGSAAFPRATLQLGDARVLCVWHEDKQRWDVQAHSDHDNEPAGPEAESGKPWLGMVQGLGVQPTAEKPHSPSASHTAGPLVEVAAEVQLWGLDKLTEVDGWVPPSAHLGPDDAGGADVWSPARAGALPAGSPRMLRVLARVGCSYLPTRVTRLARGTAAGCMTAHVRVIMAESDLVHHHVGGPPSTLLLLDLELWQQELLLSSSPLLSLPATAAPAARAPGTGAAGPAVSMAVASSMAVPPQPWWWGAQDHTVAGAVREMEECTHEVAAAQPAAPDAVHSCVQFRQDLAAWLAQVQRLAHSTQHCRCRAPAGVAGSSLHHQQLVLPLHELAQLGAELREYAAHMGWQHVRRMVGQQLRAVVRPAGRSMCVVVPPQFGGEWLAAGLDAARTALCGYRCRLDEQLYRQQLSCHLSGVLVVSTAAATVIGAVVARLGATSLIDTSVLPWTLLHCCALVSLMLGQRSGGPQGLRNPGIRRAFRLTALAFLWRGPTNLWMAVMAEPGSGDVYTHARSQPHFLFVTHLALVLIEQIPATAVLPNWATTGGLLVATLPVWWDAARLVGWQLAVSAIAALAVVVGAHIALDAHLRRQLAASHAAATGVGRLSGRLTKPDAKRL